MAEIYDPKNIEKKWQETWEKEGIYKTPDKVPGKENFYTPVEFVYPSGNLHVGHWYACAVPDIYARYQRMIGKNVLYPIGFDSFGLPAENAAIKRGLDPKAWTYENMDTMRAQLKSMGAMFDWDRVVTTSDPEYYKWTQWMFARFFEKDLVYRAQTKVNWCPKDQTILANEQVVNGKCERCDTIVEQKDQDQWSFRITKYADRLHDDLDKLDWPEEIKKSQKNWIGRSEGAEIDFFVAGQKHTIKVFTTRPETIFGATFLAVSAGLAKDWLTDKWKGNEEIKKYIEETLQEQSVRDFKEKEKTGIYAGFNVINPATKGEIPVWITNYVLDGVGTGAIMAVPAHDERDFDFANKFSLPVKYVVAPFFQETDTPTIPGKKNVYRKAVNCYIKNPKDNTYLCISWKSVDWRNVVTGGIEEGEDMVEAAKREILEETGYKNVSFKKLLGGPIRVDFYHPQKDENRLAEFYGLLFELIDEEVAEVEEKEKNLHTISWVPEAEVYDFINKGRGFFKRILDNDTGPFLGEGMLVGSGEFSGLMYDVAKQKITEFVGGKIAKTYRLRDWGISRQRYWGVPIPIVYDPDGKAHVVPEVNLPWLLPTDVDHTPDGTAPLARSKELFERTEKIFGKGWKPEVETMDTFVDSSWYFYRYLDPKNDSEFCSRDMQENWMPINIYFGGAEHTTMHLLYSRFWNKALFDLGLVKDDEPYIVRRNRGQILGPDGQKMSKSKGNVVDPDEVVTRVGTDSVRMYLAFMGPYGVTDSYPWDPNGVVGIKRFLERVWNLKEKISEGETNFAIHKTIKKVEEDIERLKFNTAISSMMILVNTLEKENSISRSDFNNLLQILAPFAPHMTEELWRELGPSTGSGQATTSIHLSEWPKYDESKMKDEKVKIIIQVNGKLRDEIEIASGASEEDVKAEALAREKIVAILADATPKKIIYVPERILNIVI